VFLRVSPIKGGNQFNIKGKFSPRYIDPYEIVEKINPIAYWLNLLVELRHVHNVLHISQLRKYVPDPNHIKEGAENLAYEEHPVQILDRRVRQLCKKSIPIVKILWANHISLKAT